MIELNAVEKTWRKPGRPPVRALAGVSLDIAPGEFAAVLGPSGSGKTTLMNVVGLLLRPDAGDYVLNGSAVADLSDDELARLRNRCIGFVFQSYYLLPRLTALENVWQPLLYSPRHDYEARAEAVLESVGLADRAHHFPGELSGGQQQRVAIARAIVNEPELILADEPTGNLDPDAARRIIEIFERLNAGGTTVIMITHDEELASRAKRIVRIEAGTIASPDGSGTTAGGRR